MPLFLYARVKFIRAQIINVPPIYDTSIDIYDASNTRNLSESQREHPVVLCYDTIRTNFPKIAFCFHADKAAQRWSKSFWLVQYARNYFTYNVFLSVFKCQWGIQYSIAVLCQKCEVNCSFSDFIDLTFLKILF